jgi:hypothetical protein
MNTRTPRALVAAAALALLAGACTDAPTTPAASTSGGRASLTASNGQPALVSNAVKYRDTGGKPATGRSGSAELQALALLSSDGTTTVKVQARHVDPAVADTGEVSKLQLKAFAADGTLKFVRNLNGEAGTAPMQLRGLARGEAVQLQAGVRGLDGNRTDLVTVTETVKRRADLGIRLAIPPTARPGVPTVIMATITEHNGDVGTRATCELLVGGQVADDARGIWVDAGDAVGCAMTHTFATAGSYALTARVRTDGGDWDEANNTDTATLTVQAPGGTATAFATEARFEQAIFTDTTWTSTSWRNLAAGTAGETADTYAHADWMGLSVMTGFLPRSIPGPVRFTFGSEIGGPAPVSASWTDSQTGHDWCMAYWVGGVGALFACSASSPDGGYTTLEYWGAGPADGVVYHSVQYGRAWDEATGTELYRYHTDWGEYLQGTRPWPLGDTYAWRVHMSAADGDYVAEKLLRLRSQRDEWRSPRECWTDEWPDYVSTTCQSVVQIFEWTESY